MTQYYCGLIWVDWKYMIPTNPYEALLYIKEMRKPAINKVIESMENSPIYTQYIQGIEITEIK